jgi:hypothetical protein
MSFWKHEPPKPGDGSKKRLPIPGSVPIDRDTSSMCAPLQPHPRADRLRCYAAADTKRYGRCTAGG